MTTHDGLLQAIIDNPGDDGPRLIFADRAEESGDAARAEFIRVQCELARIGHEHPNNERAAEWGGMCVRCHPLLIRERKLWYANGQFWFPDTHRGAWRTRLASDLTQPNGGPTAIVRRGFIESVTVARIEDWCGKTCTLCGGNGVGRRIGNMWSKCGRCNRKGTVGGVGPRLVACQPVTEVWAADREPYFNEVSGHWSWWVDDHAGSDHTPSDLPREVYRLLPGQHYPSGWKKFDTEADALAALSTALLRLAAH